MSQTGRWRIVMGLRRVRRTLGPEGNRGACDYQLERMLQQPKATAALLIDSALR